MRARQASLPGFEKIGIKSFGGSRLRGNPKEARPVSVKRPMHLVLRASRARGELSLLAPNRARRVEKVAYGLGKKLGVRVYRYANSGNHLHLVVRPRSRKAFQAYARALPGILARIALNAERGRVNQSEKGSGAEKFWDSRPFTRILEWGREFKTVARYVVQNAAEAIGFAAYRPRGRPPP